MDPKTFCRYCDKGPNGFKDYNPCQGLGVCSERKKHASQEICTQSRIEGVEAVMSARTVYFPVIDRAVLRRDPLKIKEALKASNRRAVAYVSPAESPLKKACSGSGIFEAL